MEYILIILADLLLGFNFIATKAYQNSEGISLSKAMKFNIYIGAVSAVMFLIFQKFNFEINVYSLIMAALQALLCILYTIIGFKIMSDGKIAVYTIFLMTGGMVIPYIWGVLFLNEQFSYVRTIGLCVIIIAIFISYFGDIKINIRQLLLCFAVFILNGFVSVISKEHQISGLGVSSTGFCVLSSLLKVLICFAALPFISALSQEKKSGKLRKKSLLLIAAVAALSGFSYLIQLVAAKNLPATVLYPVITGGSIVITAIMGRIIYKEKLTKQIVLAIICCIAGMCMFA